MTVNPYQAISSSPAIKDLTFKGDYSTYGGTPYGVFNPYGQQAGGSSEQLQALGWQPGMPAPSLPFPSNKTFQTPYNADDLLNSGGVSQEPYTQNYVDALFKSYTDTHNSDIKAKLDAYTKSMGNANPGGFIPPTLEANKDPWETLNSMGMYKPENDLYGNFQPMGNNPFPDPWQPMGMGPANGVTSFGKYWGANGYASGNGPGGWNPSNITTHFDSQGNDFTTSPWGTWDAGGVGMKYPQGNVWTPSQGTGTPWYNG